MKRRYKFHPIIKKILKVGEDIVFHGTPDLIKIHDPEGKLFSLFISSTSFDLSDMLSVASSREEEADLSAVFSILIERGLLVDETEAASVDNGFNNWIDFIARTTQGHYSQFGLLTGTKAAERFSVYAVGSGELVERLTTLLCATGISAASGNSIPTEPSDLCVILGDGTKDSLLYINNEIVRLQRAALYIEIATPIISIGPLYVPRSSACYNCLQMRLNSNVVMPFDNESISGHAGINMGLIPIAIAAGLAANIIYELAHGLRHMVPAGTLINFDLSTHTSSNTLVVRSPRCSVCAASMANYTATSHFRVTGTNVSFHSDSDAGSE